MPSKSYIKAIILNIMTVVFFIHKQSRSAFFSCYTVSTLMLSLLTTSIFLNQSMQERYDKAICKAAQSWKKAASLLKHIHVVINVCHPFLKKQLAKIVKQLAFFIRQPGTFDNPCSEFINGYGFLHHRPVYHLCSEAINDDFQFQYTHN